MRSDIFERLKKHKVSLLGQQQEIHFALNIATLASLQRQKDSTMYFVQLQAIEEFNHEVSGFQSANCFVQKFQSRKFATSSWITVDMHQNQLRPHNGLQSWFALQLEIEICCN